MAHDMTLTPSLSQKLVDRSIQVKIRRQSRLLRPPLTHVEVKLGDNPLLFHFSGSQDYCQTILELLSWSSKSERLASEDLDFRAGSNQADVDAITGKSSACPYPCHTSAHLWWQRGYDYSKRLHRAIAAEDKVRKAAGIEDKDSFPNFE